MVEGIAGTKLRSAGLRPTRQRLIIGELLWKNGNRHVTAEILHNEIKAIGASVSMATIYNTLHQFVDAGLLKEVYIDSGSALFDTNTKPHHHFYFEQSRYLEDIDAEAIRLPEALPKPSGCEGTVKSIEITIRMQDPA